VAQSKRYEIATLVFSVIFLLLIATEFLLSTLTPAATKNLGAPSVVHEILLALYYIATLACFPLFVFIALQLKKNFPEKYFQHRVKLIGCFTLFALLMTARIAIYTIEIYALSVLWFN
jgi:hypothetical protein